MLAGGPVLPVTLWCGFLHTCEHIDSSMWFVAQKGEKGAVDQEIRFKNKTKNRVLKQPTSQDCYEDLLK